MLTECVCVNFSFIPLYKKGRLKKVSDGLLSACGKMPSKPSGRAGCFDFLWLLRQKSDGEH
jgi:hypothetical protein